MLSTGTIVLTATDSILNRIMQAHRRAAAIPLLSGAANYKEWSQKVELQMRIQKIWPAVIGPPVPIECERVETDTRPDLGLQDYTYVASRKHIYIQSSELVVRSERRLQPNYWNNRFICNRLAGRSCFCLDS